MTMNSDTCFRLNREEYTCIFGKIATSNVHVSFDVDQVNELLHRQTHGGQWNSTTNDQPIRIKCQEPDRMGALIVGQFWSIIVASKILTWPEAWAHTWFGSGKMLKMMLYILKILFGEAWSERIKLY